MFQPGVFQLPLIVSTAASLRQNQSIPRSDLILNHLITYLSLCHFEVCLLQTHLRQLQCFVARVFLLFVDLRLEAFVDEREVPSQHESMPTDK